MSEHNVVSFADAKAKRAERRSLSGCYALRVERFEGQTPAEFHLSGLGNDTRHIDVDRVCRDMVDAALCLSADHAAAGGIGPRVIAAVLFFDTGTVSSTIDGKEFNGSPLRQRWMLEDQIAHVRQSLLNNFAALPK